MTNTRYAILCSVILFALLLIMGTGVAALLDWMGTTDIKIIRILVLSNAIYAAGEKFREIRSRNKEVI